MSLNAILEAILAAGEARAVEIERQSHTQAREILAEAHAEAQLLEEQSRARALAPAARERAGILHRARLEALRITGAVRESLVDAALDQTRGRLASIRSDPIYPEVLGRLTREALDELEASCQESAGQQLLADGRDRSLLEGILAGLARKPAISYDLESWGGVVARSKDSRVVVINLLEARLERATPYLRHALAALFEEEREEAKDNEVYAQVAAY